MPVSLGDVLRLSGVAMLWLAGALAVVGIGYFIPTRPEISLLLGVARVPVRADADGLRDHPAADGGPRPGQPTAIALGGTDLTFSDAALFFAFFPAAIFAQRPVHPGDAVPRLVRRHLRGADPVHGDRQPLPGQRDRVGARRAAHRGRAGRGLEHRPRGPRAAGADADPGRLLGCSAVSVDRPGPHRSTPTATSAASSRAGPTTCTRTPPVACFGIAAAVAYARPTWVRWPPLFAQACFWICLAGIAITQSRQAMAGLAVALIVIVMRTHNSGRERRSKVILLAVAAGMGFILVMVRNQVASGQRVQLLLPARRLVRRVDPHLADRPAVRRRPALVVHRPVRDQVPASQRRPGDAEHGRPRRSGRASSS